MRLGGNRLVQWAVIIGFASIFGFLAMNLIEKQRNRLTFQSFINGAENTSIILNDIDRVCNKRLLSTDLGIFNTSLAIGFDKVVSEKKTAYNDILGRKVLLSFNDDEFVVVFEKSNLKLNDVQVLLENELGLATAQNDKKITIEDQSYFYEYFTNYLVFSNAEISLSDNDFEPIRYGNADYVQIKNGQFVRFLQTPKIIYSSYSQKDSIKGAPVRYKELFNVVPNDFQSVNLYGSSRFETDQKYFFNSDKFNWCESYIAVLKKDSFELLISPIGLERDLKLILEEETLNNLADSVQIEKFNMATFEVMKIQTKDNWPQEIPSMSKDLNYFTQLSNFNVLGNSPEAIRWILTSWQIGSLCSNSDNLLYLIDHYLPYRMNTLDMQKREEGWSVEGKVKVKEDVLIADLQLKEERQSVSGIKNLFENDLSISPSQMQIIGSGDKTQLILINNSKIEARSTNGELLYTKSLNGQILKIQAIDFENDGNLEIAFFTNTGVEVLNAKGSSKPGFPIVISEPCYGGKILNYDNKFDHRIFIGVGNSVQCYSEQGKKVDGWQFAGMGAPLFGEIRYTQVEGKDYLIFQNKLNQFFAVSRRGEPRNTPSKILISESFAAGVWGSSINSLYVTGYRKGFIYRYFIASPLRDSSAIDVEVNPSSMGWEKINDQECLWIDQNEQLYQFDRFGFVMKKILKPAPNVEFAGYLSKSPERYVFADNANKKLYLLNERGELITDNPLDGTSVWAATTNRFYSCQGSKLIAYEIN